ncbi:MAG: hypothetical protein IID15_06230, partial [Candidatus Marinimicrobia bacterium]|nr:hypothetical protein [Candidatus Neomarinimicrobiota bacterium]
FAQGMQAGAGSLQEDLFGAAAGGVVSEPALPDVPDWPEEQLYKMEKELTGYYLTGHPLKLHETDIVEFANYDFTDASQAMRLDVLRLGGMVSQLKKHHTKKGRPMGFFTLEGLLGRVEVVVFSDLFEKVENLLTEDSKVFVIGKPTTRNSGGGGSLANGGSGNDVASGGEIKLLAEDIIPLEAVRQRLARVVYVRLAQSRLNPRLVQQLGELANRSR